MSIATTSELMLDAVYEERERCVLIVRRCLENVDHTSRMGGTWTKDALTDLIVNAIQTGTMPGGVE